jgi:broad specificity phosphatase PhoE
MKRSTLLHLAFTTLICLLFAACNTARKEAVAQFGNEKMTTIYLVRHAEKQFDRDPLLTDMGTERAERLKEILKNVKLSAVYSSDTRRTQLTAAPTAADHNLKVTTYNVGMLSEFSDLVLTLHRGKSILIVGHSNTTPAMANYLTKTDEFPRFSELDYTNFYVVNIPRIGKARVLTLRY